METNPNQLKEILGELFSLLEAMETSNLAVLQFLKDKGIANEKEFAHFLDQAGNASSVKWRAARARMEYLLTPIKKENLEEEKHEAKDIAPKKEEDTTAKTSKEQKSENEKGGKLVADLGAAGIEDTGPKVNTEPKKNSEVKNQRDEQNRTASAKTEDNEKNPKKPDYK